MTAGVSGRTDGRQDDESRRGSGAGVTRLTARGIALLYLAVSVVWIVFSDRVLRLVTGDAAEQAWLQTAKGLGFVFASTVALYLLVQRLTAHERTARERAERLEERYSRLFQFSPMINLILGQDGTILDANDAVLKQLGFSREELVGRSALEFVEEAQRGELLALLERDFRGEETPAVEAVVLARDGTRHTILLSPGQVLITDAERGPAVLIAGLDITERKMVDDALRESEATLERAQGVAHVGSWVSDCAHEGQLTWSKEACRIFGIPEEEFDGRVETFFACVHPEDVEAVKQASREAIEGVTPSYRIDHRIVRRDGSIRWIHERADIERDAEGRPRRMIGVAWDITEWKQAEAGLLASEERWRNLVEHAPIGIVVHRDNRFRYANAQALAIFGARTPEELIGREVLATVHPETREIARKRIRAISDSGVTAPVMEQTIVRPDGSQVQVEVAGTPCEYEGNRAVQTSIRDVSERKRSEDALRQSEARFQIVASATTDAVWDWNLLTNELWWNDGITRLFGHPPEELGPALDWWVENIHGEERDGVTRRLHEAIERGDEFWEDVYRFRKSDGTYAVVHDRGRVIRNGDGRPVRMLGGMTDITERKAAERRQALMMQELDHRVKNNLAAVISIADSTLASSGSLTDFRRAFTGRIGALARIHALLANMKWEGVSMVQMVRQTLEAFSPDSGARVSIQGEDFLLPARAAAPLCMALHELATNAAKYGALRTPEGSVEVSWTRDSESAAARCVRIRWREAGGEPIEPPRRPGLGSELIKGVIEYELAGQVTLAFPSSGASCDIVIPISDAPSGLRSGGRERARRAGGRRAEANP